MPSIYHDIYKDHVSIIRQRWLNAIRHGNQAREELQRAREHRTTMREEYMSSRILWAARRPEMRTLVDSAGESLWDKLLREFEQASNRKDAAVMAVPLAQEHHARAQRDLESATRVWERTQRLWDEYNRNQARNDSSNTRARDHGASTVGESSGASRRTQIADWQTACEKAFEDYSSIEAFPDPPHWPCPSASCRASQEGRALDACLCNIKEAYRNLPDFSEVVRQHRLRFHPDRFSAVREENRQVFQAKASEIFVVVNELYEASRDH